MLSSVQLRSKGEPGRAPSDRAQGFLCSSGSASGSLSHSRRRVTCLGSLRSYRPIGRLSPVGSKMPALLMRGTGWGGSSSLCCRSFALCQCPCVQLCQRCWLCPELLETQAEGQVPAGAGVAQVSEASASGGLRGQGELRWGSRREAPSAAALLEVLSVAFVTAASRTLRGAAERPESRRDLRGAGRAGE